MFRPTLLLLVLAALSACQDSQSLPGDRPAPAASAGVPSGSDSPPVRSPSATTRPDAEAPAEPLAAALPIPYRLASPDRVVELGDELREVSGLTVLPGGLLGVVQDEAGVLYRIDARTGAVRSREAFQARGDFEGVEAVGRDVWILRSNGDLTRLRPAGSAVDAVTFETALAARNDAEGLAYDAPGNRLLIACKENPGNGLRDVRAVYAFDLATNRLGPTPVFTLDRTLLDAADPFKPSAIAVRPGSGDVYILSSVRKALVVLAPDGTVRAVVALPRALYAQPEGIAFTADGTLYISNEGPDGPATLLRFDPTDR